MELTGIRLYLHDYTVYGYMLHTLIVQNIYRWWLSAMSQGHGSLREGKWEHRQQQFVVKHLFCVPQILLHYNISIMI